MTYTIGPVTPFTEPSCDVWSYSFQRRSFYANGRHWMFYREAGGDGEWRTSIDGLNWTAASVFRNVGYSVAFAIHFDGTYVHYVYEDGADNDLYYRRGIPNANGTITWSAAEQTVLAGVGGYRHYWVTIGVDSGGYPWIGYQYRGSVGDRYPYVIKSSTNDGTWTTKSGFPYQLSAVADNSWVAIPLALTNNKMYVIYSRDGQTLGQLWSGSPGFWGSEEDSGADPFWGSTISATTDDDDVLLVISETATDNLVFFRRTYGVGWGGGVTIYNGNAVEYPILTHANTPTLGTPDALYVFWLPDSANPTADHIWYRKSVDGGATWTDEAGVDANEDWIDESADGFSTCPESLALYMHAGYASSYIGLGYSTKPGAPRDIKYVILDADPTGSEDLFAKFIVAQDSQELLARFEVGQGSQDLLANAEIRQPASVELLGRCVIRHDGTPIELLGKGVIRHDGPPVELLGKGVIRHDAYVELLNKCVIRHDGTPIELFSKGVIRHDGPPVELLGKGVIRHDAYVELLNKCVIRHDGTPIELFSKGVIRHDAFIELLNKCVIRHDGTPIELFSKGVIRHDGTPVELLGKGVIRHDGPPVELLGKGVIRHPDSINLSGKFWVRWPTRLWTNRRYLNGVIQLTEKLIGDARLEYAIEGVMEDIQGYLENNDLPYDEWTDITLLPVQILRATTYGVVAALYARHTQTFEAEIIPSITPVTVTVIGDAEKAMNFWTERMEEMLTYYVSFMSGAILATSTEDEEPIFSMEDIPEEVTAYTPWRKWLSRRGSR